MELRLTKEHSAVPLPVASYLQALCDTVSLEADPMFVDLAEQMLEFFKDGNWNASRYTIGVANGLLLAAQTVLPLASHPDLVVVVAEEDDEPTDGSTSTGSDVASDSGAGGSVVADGHDAPPQANPDNSEQRTPEDKPSLGPT